MVRARFLSAVSGGSYLAAGLAISHAMSPAELCDDSKPWSHNSPEEQRLRLNLSYLAPGNAGGIWLLANLVYGLVLNLTPLLLGAFLAGRLVGSLLHIAYPGIGGNALDGTPFVAATALAVGLVVAVVPVVGMRRFYDKDQKRDRLGSRGELVVTWLAGASAVVFALGIVLPAVIHLGAHVSISGHVGGTLWARVRARVLLGLVVVLICVAAGAVAVWLLRRRRLERLRGVLAGISGLGILLTPFLLAAATAARRGVTLPTDAYVYAAVLFVMGLFAVFGHNRRYSMHLFYRERLQDAFATRRVRNEDGTVKAEGIPYAKSVHLSQIVDENRRRSRNAADAFPELIVCAAVAARGKDVPYKARAASFTFEGDMTRNHQQLKRAVPTRQLEHGDWIGGGDITLPSMMAISGAAISPLMGRFTLPAFRFLLAMLNVRLGVWIRNPDGSPVAEVDASAPWFRRARRYVKRGWQEPGAWYVLKEGLGLAGRSDKYIYVSDGGHWENLGLTELLRKRCSHIVVVDASGDRHLGDIARAVAIARAELGVEIQLDPRPTSPGDDGLAEQPVQVGRFRYPDGREGDIFYARCVMWKDAPSDLHILRRRETLFPHHPTSNQFLSGELFDAYRALGSAVGKRLAKAIALPDPRYDEPPAGAMESEAVAIG
jgi:hypothetical protein